jgi:phosphoglycerate dehydrogenase-like enzyme
MVMLPDGTYDVIVIDAEFGDDGDLHIEVTISLGPRVGEVIRLRRRHIERGNSGAGTEDPYALLGVPGTLRVRAGQPTFRPENAMRRPSDTGDAAMTGDTPSNTASDTRSEKVTGEDGVQHRSAVIAAPPWAARGLADMAESGALDVAVRHVMVGDDPVDGDEATGVQVLWRYHLSPERLGRAVDELPDLRWVHSDYVGVEELPLATLAERGILLSNGAGIAARPMAEWVVLAILSAAKALPRFVRQSDARLWETGSPLVELDGAVVLLLGLGAVGTLAAAMLEPFGAEVRACTRRPRPDVPRGVTRMVVGDAWRQELPDADYVVCALPLTTETTNMLDEDAFTAMKRGAYLVNVARGGLVDDDALIAALDSGHLGGAVLDAFRQEPAPPEHPLWGRADVLALPHVTWSSAHTLDHFKWRFAAQLNKWLSGDAPADLVDLDAGY